MAQAFKMILLFSATILLVLVNISQQFEMSDMGYVAGATQPLQRMRISANAYFNNIKQIANLGECVNRTVTKEKNRRINCNPSVVPKVGKSQYYFRPKTELIYRRMESTHQGTSILSIGASVGVGAFMGLLKASVKVTGTTTIKTSASSLILMASMDYTRGVLSLTDTGKEIANLNSHLNDKYFVSDILLGTEETLYVKMDFESWQKKTEVEIKIKIKVVFFTITATMRFVKTEARTSGKVEVVRSSTYQNKVERRTFSVSQFDSAIAHVDAIEKEYAELPNTLKSEKLVPNSKLHRMYSLLPFKKDLKNYLADSATKLLYIKLVLTHQADATDTIEMADDILKKMPFMHPACKTAVNTIKSQAGTKNIQLENILQSTFSLTDAQVKSNTENVLRGMMPHFYKTKFFSTLNDYNVPY